MKALTSLEVARQCQANRAQLHLGIAATSQGQTPCPPQTAAGQLQPSRLPQAPHLERQAGQVRQGGLLGAQPAGDFLGRRLGSISEKPPVQLQGAPAQQARAKLEAIRSELGMKPQDSELLIRCLVVPPVSNSLLPWPHTFPALFQLAPSPVSWILEKGSSD